ncbi:MAG TPA: ketopantoate reductase family protein [Thermodesulfobacteriota bacterium]
MSSATIAPIWVVGCGAVGGVLGAHLTRSASQGEPGSGEDLRPWLVCRPGSHLDAIRAQGGLRVRGPDYEGVVPVRVAAGVAEVPGAPGTVLLAVKAGDVEAACRELVPRLEPRSMVVSLQNGLCEERIAAVVGRERTIGAIVGWGATLARPGEVVQTSRGHTTIGELDGTVTPRLRALEALLEVVEPVRVSTNILGALWTKLIINSATSTLGAVTGLTLGEMLSKPVVRWVARHLVAESVRVADAEGIRLEPFGGRVDLRRVAWRAGGGIGAWWHNLAGGAALRLAANRYRGLRSVMLQDLDRGRRTEVDDFNGVLVARGAARGVPTPLNAALVEMVHEIERGERQSRIENVGPLLALIDARGGRGRAAAHVSGGGPHVG